MLKISWCGLQDDSLHCSEWNVSLLQYFVMITKGIMSDHYQHLLIIYIYMHIYIYHTYICIYVYTYMNVCTYIFIIYTYVYLYIHVYIDQYLPIIYVYIYIFYAQESISMDEEWVVTDFKLLCSLTAPHQHFSYRNMHVLSASLGYPNVFQIYNILIQSSEVNILTE